MSTNATDALKALAADWKKSYASAKVSGIVGDLAHQARGGYHISREDQSNKANYSVVRPDDKSGPADAAAAIDMTMNPADMKLCTGRLVAAFSNTNDPRRKYLNAFNGTLDGKTAKRWDIYARTTKGATEDHLWHVHLEIRRKYVTSTAAMKAILSILRGESPAKYLASIGVTVKAASSVTTSVPPFPGTLRRNDSQTSPISGVRLFQNQLRARGWTSQGPSDGYFGAKLEATVKKWQKSCGLSADGVIGAKTWPTLWTRSMGS